MEEIRPGLVVGERYELVRRIGAGGMGEVWEARHVKIGRRLAVKFLLARFGLDAQAVARFKQEAQIAGSIGHDNICPVLDVGSAPGGAHYLVMELLRGTTLREELTDKSVFKPERALDVVSQVLAALGAAHEGGIVHRDLKPENVFLTKVGDREDFVRVLDFGISKILDSAASGSALTQTGGVLGTPSYMAPEQARGSRDQDARIDVYACGVLLYELVTGRRPYEADNLQALMVKILLEPFPVPRAHNPELPHEVEEIILRAMARDRSDRYGTAEAMRHRILTVRARGFSPEAAPGRAIATASTDPGFTPFSTTRATLPPEPGPRTSRRILAGTAVVLALVGGLSVARWVSLVVESAVPASPSPSGREAAPAPARSPMLVPFAVSRAIEPAAAPASPFPGSGEDQSVVIGFTDLPADARVFWDGAEVPAVPLRVQRRVVMVPLRIEHQGRVVRSLLVTPDRDQVFDADAPQVTSARQVRTSRVALKQRREAAASAPAPASNPDSTTDQIPVQLSPRRPRFLRDVSEFGENP